MDVGYRAGGICGSSDGESVGNLAGMFIMDFFSDWWLERGLQWEKHLYDEFIWRTWWEGTGSREEEHLVR